MTWVCQKCDLVHESGNNCILCGASRWITDQNDEEKDDREPEDEYEEGGQG